MMLILSSLLKAKLIMLVTFVLVLAGLLVLLAVKPKKYEAHMSFLVRDERAQSLVSADPTQTGLQKQDLTEERINSEVALLGSAGVLRAVIIDQGLEKIFLNSNGSNQAESVEKAMRKLSQHLDVFGVRKSAVIEVSYTCESPDQAKSVLDSLSKEYLREYLRLHSDHGAAGFYQQKLTTVGATLANVQSDRAKLLQQNGFMLLPEGQSLGLRELVDLEKSYNDTQATLVETQSRLASVTAQQSRTPARLLTQRKSSANQTSVEQLNTKLVDLRNQLTGLRTKFVDSDPFVKQTEQQIADTKVALEGAKAIRSEDITSDINQNRQALDAQADQLNQSEAGLASRLRALDTQMKEAKTRLGKTEQASIAVDTLDRDIKVLQETAEFYQGRFLSATAAEQMDSETFSNVVEVTYPTVPVLPVASGFNVITSFLLAGILAVGAGLASSWRDRIGQSEVSVL